MRGKCLPLRFQYITKYGNIAKIAAQGITKHLKQLSKHYKTRSKQVTRDLMELGISTRNANRIEREAKSHAARALIELIELMHEKELTVDYLRACKVMYSANDCRVLVRHDGKGDSLS